MKKVDIKIGSFHPEEFAISAIILCLQEMLEKIQTVLCLDLQTAGRKLSALES